VRRDEFAGVVKIDDARGRRACLPAAAWTIIEHGRVRPGLFDDRLILAEMMPAARGGRH